MFDRVALRLSEEVFSRYLGQGWIHKLAPYKRSGWQVWGITDAGREEARLRPEPSRAEIRAAKQRMRAHRSPAVPARGQGATREIRHGRAR